MKACIEDIEKIAKKARLKQSTVIDVLRIEIVPKAKNKFSSDEINQLAKLVKKKVDEFFLAGPPF